MARLASAADFEGGSLYSEYRRYPFFAQRAALIHQRWPTGKILVVGCGWGFLVDELLRLGRDAWGIDASSYAVTKGQSLAGQSGQTTQEGLDNGMLAQTASRIILADASNRAQLTAVKNTAGVVGNNKFGVVVTEDVLPVLTDAEVTIAINECRRIGTNILHIVTPGDPADPAKLSGLTWKPIGQWRTLCAPDLVLDAETGAVG